MEGDGLLAEGKFLAFIWLISMVTANRHFYVATFFLWYPNLIICYLNI